MSLQRSLLFTFSLHLSRCRLAAKSGDFAGMVDIGGGRKMYLECRGTGSPTVFIVPGGKGLRRRMDQGLARLRRCCQVHAGLRL